MVKRSSSLEQLTIKSLGVIESAELEFGPGLTVLTGETGAGKTMVLTAIGLILGGKADSDFVRTGSERLSVGALFNVGEELATQVEEIGGVVEDGELTISRGVSDAGKSRSTLAGVVATNAQLSELGQNLVEIHAQSSTARLAKNSVQRELLDRFGGNEAVLSQYQSVLATYKELHSRIAVLKSQLKERDSELEAIATFLADFNKVTPVAGELEAIDNEISKLGSVEAIHADLSLVLSLLSDDDTSVTNLLNQARKPLEGLREKDLELDPLIDNFLEAHYSLQESAGEIARYLSSLEADPARFEYLQQRKAAITALLKKHGKGSDKNAAYLQLIEDGASASTRVKDLQGGDARLEELEAELNVVFGELAKAAKVLSGKRQQAAADLALKVSVELKALSMPAAEFTISVIASDMKEIKNFSDTGVDEVHYLFASHPGANPLPINKAASGGELSRIMLALEVVLAATSPVGTYIFDEVDAGVGGKAAVEVGRRLAALAKSAQVIVVTHLAQVAVWADTHLVINKDQSGSYSLSSVIKVDGANRAREVARLLSGQEDSQTAQEHAAELLKMAEASV